MRESLEKLGRFDPVRARERLRNSFYPEATHFIVLKDEKIGFYTFRRMTDRFQLDHLYIHPSHQQRGAGSLVMAKLIAEASALGLPIHLGALKGSGSNRFYVRHGFVAERDDEWDVYYTRSPEAGPDSRT
jgi:GNAT superfamily N-acetyltransferase